MQTSVVFHIRAYRPTDPEALAAVFIAAIRETASKDYDKAQIDAWAQVDRKTWARQRLSSPTWVAIIGRSAVGFADLEPDGHLDMMFVHPAHQRSGIATALLTTVEAAARAQRLSRIFTEASIPARPFFERHGFSVISAQHAEIRGQRLTNYRMAKLLP